MPEFTPYPNEGSGDFAKRMSSKGKGGIVKAAGRYLQTSAQKDQKKGITRNY